MINMSISHVKMERAIFIMYINDALRSIIDLFITCYKYLLFFY